MICNIKKIILKQDANFKDTALDWTCKNSREYYTNECGCKFSRF